MLLENIIILGRNYSTTLSIARALGAKGCRVDVIYVSVRKDTRIVSACKYVNNCIEIPRQEPKEILEAIRRMRRDRKQVLFPTDDFTVELLDRNRDELSRDFLLPYINNNDPVRQIEYYMNKQVQLELAQREGFSTAKSWVISLTEDEIPLPSDLVYPCFVKPLLSANGGKNEIGKCASEAELLEKLIALQKKGRSVILVQEFLNITCEYVIGGVCKDQQVLVPGVIKKTRIAKHNKGVTVSGTLHSTDLLPANTIEKTESLLKSFRYVGMYDLELIEADDKLFFGEMNLRCGGPNYIYTLSGINLPWLAVKAMLNEGIEESTALTFGKSFVNDKVVWEDYLFGDITKKELKECYCSADVSLTDSTEDPEPGKVFRRKMRIKVAKKWIKRILRMNR